MRGAAAPRTPRLKRKDTLHAYRVAANATDLLAGEGSKQTPLGNRGGYAAPIDLKSCSQPCLRSLLSK